MISYLQAIKINNINFSIDMIRLNFEISKDKEKEFTLFIRKHSMIYKNYKHYQSFRLFTYKDLFTFSDEPLTDNEELNDLNIPSLTIGFGFNTGKSPDLMKGFIEYNPNKSYKVFKDLLVELKDICYEFEFVRYDLACDIPIDRYGVFLLRDDKRRYFKHSTMISTNTFDTTEYLGTRNTGGFVKLYNKRIESKLDYDLTRLEITLDDLDYNIFKKRFPKVYYHKDVSSFDLFDQTDKVIFSLMCELGSFEKINFLGRDKKQKFKNFLESDFVDITELQYRRIINLLTHIIDLKI